VVELLNHPNPTESSTGFFYHLTDTADRVRAEVYTLTGKRIRVLDGLSGRVGYNANPEAWDGADADGERVANGVYLFRVVALRAGERAEAIGKAVVTR
jgi:flagellar hook assembly protein FlgD